MPPIDRPKRMLVRTSLVAGSTVATLLGAQTLINVDQQNPALNPSTSGVQVQIQSTSVPEQPKPTATVAVVHTLPTLHIVHIAPVITIVRQTGQPSSQAAQIIAEQPTAVATPVVIKPPVPIQVAAPTPVIVQQQSVNPPANAPSSGGGQQAPAPRTHSSH